MARDYDKQKLVKLNGVMIDTGEVVFTTTATTVEVYTPFSKIYSYQLQPGAACDAGEAFYLDETVGADGAITVSNGSVTLTRIAGTTSALKMYYTFFGID